MTKYMVNVLFKNGVEKNIECSSEDAEMEKVIDHIETVYLEKGKSIIQLGNAFINVKDTVCIEFVVIEDEGDNE